MNKVIKTPSMLGMLGGGQLGKFFVEAAHRMGYQVEERKWRPGNRTLGPSSKLLNDQGEQELRLRNREKFLWLIWG